MMEIPSPTGKGAEAEARSVMMRWEGANRRDGELLHATAHGAKTAQRTALGSQRFHKDAPCPSASDLSVAAGKCRVNTLPPATLEAFRDHGEVRQSVTTDVGGAERTLAALEAAGVSLEAVTDKLLVEGLASFEQSFVTLLAGLARKRASLASAAAPVGATA